MIITDDVYGSYIVDEPLLLDLIGSEAIQRLREISQAGASSLVRAGRSVTRYEHSIGVMLLTRTLGGEIVEQAAGLLHDVSHTAFSHTIDYVFRDCKEKFHETIFAEVLEESDIPRTLAEHNLNWRQLFEPTNLKIVDAQAPLLCADRVDYTLRDLVRFGYITAMDAQAFVANLSVNQNAITCGNAELAERFVRWYAYLVENLFMHPVELYVHDEFAKLIRDALMQHVLTTDDLLKVDSAVLEKLDSQLWSRERLATLRQTTNIAIGDGPGARRVFSKARIVDPLISSDGMVVPLSQIRPELKVIWGNILKVSTEGCMVRQVM
ncbi:MAG TPA: HD domain-containing protein [Pyrinomonadaceae bacterium]|nr:HD domain-containing protein [Pyrinomonadaceae bacterium]